MKPSTRSKRTAESRTAKSPEPKRQSTGPTDPIPESRKTRPRTAADVEKKREEQKKKFAAYMESKKAKEEERKKQMAARPAWRPAGGATTRR